MMKYIIILTFAATITLLASVIRDGTLQARSDGNNITVQWGSTDESQVKEYQVVRRNGTTGDFGWVATVAKKGSNSYYEYVDRSAFKTTGSVYQYQIVTVFTNGNTEYSSIVTVSHNVSSVKRTWGSLKAMFR
jgi:hypothetical protein